MNNQTGNGVYNQDLATYYIENRNPCVDSKQWPQPFWLINWRYYFRQQRYCFRLEWRYYFRQQTSLTHELHFTFSRSATLFVKDTKNAIIWWVHFANLQEDIAIHKTFIKYSRKIHFKHQSWDVLHFKV